MEVLENKVPPPIVTILFAIAMWVISLLAPIIDVDTTARWVAMAVVLVAGFTFSLLGILSFRKAATTVNPLKPETASSLVNSGIFQVSRNPMYVGFVLYLLAWAIYLSSAWVFLFIIGFVLYINRFQIEPEERALLVLFGAEFEKYQSEVRRWL